MLRYLLLGLCLSPLIAQAEVACLEGPQGGKCHTVDVNGEVFKTAEPSQVTRVTTPTVNQQATNKQRRINSQIPASTNKQVASRNSGIRKNMPRRMGTAEQRIRQRAQLVEARFMHKQGITNLSQLDNNNDSYIKRKQQSAELRRRIEN